MGCFDYTCECGGKTCDHIGGQNVRSNVIIEVPLKDGRTIHLEGEYSEYGYVDVGEYMFYLTEFEEHFYSWLEDESEEDRKHIFTATKVWTVEDHMHDRRNNEYFEEKNCYSGPIAETNYKKYLDKFVRADEGLDIPSDKEKTQHKINQLKIDIENYENYIKIARQQLERLEKTL